MDIAIWACGVTGVLTGVKLFLPAYWGTVGFTLHFIALVVTVAAFIVSLALHSRERQIGATLASEDEEQ